jgi:hypothetical protein
MGKRKLPIEDKLVLAPFKIKKATWCTFLKLYPRKASLMIRQFIEECIKNGK